MYEDQLEYAREQVGIWRHLSLEDCYDQIDAHLESEFGRPYPGVITDALWLEGVL